MDNIPSDETKKAKQEQQLIKLRPLWMVLTVAFAIIILLNLYNWSQGDGSLRSIVSPLGMIFVGLTMVIGSRNKTLSYIFLVIAGILVISGLIMAFMH